MNGFFPLDLTRFNWKERIEVFYNDAMIKVVSQVLPNFQESFEQQLLRRKA